MDTIFAKIRSFELFSADTVVGNKFQRKHRQCANLVNVNNVKQFLMRKDS